MAGIFYLGGLYEMSGDMCRPSVSRDENGLPVWMNGEAGGGDSSDDAMALLIDAVSDSSDSSSSGNDSDAEENEADAGEDGGD